MSDTTPGERDDAGPADDDDPPVEGAAVEGEEDGGADATAGGAVGGTGALAERAKQMLERAKDQGARIVEAARGDDPPDRGEGTEKGAIVAAATTSVPGDTAGTDRDTGAVAATPIGPAAAGGDGGDSGGGQGGADDDEDFFPELPISGTNQIIWLGLLAAVVLFFGSALWSLAFGSDEAAPSDGATPVVDATSADPPIDDGLSGVDADGGSEAVASSTTTLAPTTTEAPSTTEAPTTTEASTTTAQPTTSAAAATADATTTTTTTTEPGPDVFTMWDALSESGQANQFATFGAVLGLREALEDPSVDRTLFAPSDAALAALDPAVLDAVVADAEVAGATLVGYHFVDESLTAADLLALDGDQITTSAGLPISVSAVDGQVVLNGTTTVVGTDFTSDNGVVHVIDLVLSPPTVNEVLDLENIEFEVNSAVLTPAGQAELQKAIDYFTANSDLVASIEGHTDTDGSDDLNLTLSQERAEAVREFLIAAGLAGDRFTATGFGETRPILVDGVEDKDASRRIEFIIR